MTCLHSLRFASLIVLSSAVFGCGDSSGPGGENQGGNGPSVVPSGGSQNVGGENAGGDSAGGDSAGGRNAGGDDAGGENAGGGASFADCQKAASELVEIYKGCGIDVEGEADCEGADYDLVVCAEQCAEDAPCGAFTGDDPDAAQIYADCLELCM